MIFKKICLYIFIITSILTSYTYPTVGTISFFNMPTIAEKFPVVIQLSLSPLVGGLERCLLAQNQYLLEQGITSIIICRENTFISQCAKEQKVPVVTCSQTSIGTSTFLAKGTIINAIKQTIAKFPKQQILAIHCNWEDEVLHANRATWNIPIVLTKHIPGEISKDIRQITSGVITVSRDHEKYIKNLNQTDGIQGEVITLPPFFDDKKFISYQSSENRKIFFKKNFGIEVKNGPLLVKIARFYGSGREHKNHLLLFEAIQELTFKRNFPIQVALAGDGDNFEIYKKKVQELNLSDYIYFLGHTEKTPQLLEYADINLLASKNEAFGIALLEGGIMKKPTIIAKGTGAADWLIIDKETGFLFENNDMQSLADTIQYALTHKEEAEKYGQKLYEKVIAEFIPRRNIKKLIEFYKTVATKKYASNLNT